MESAFAQLGDSLTYPYKITGTIYDSRGNPLPGVNVVSHGDGNMQVSDGDGKYYAFIYGPQTAVLFSYLRFSTLQYCPDGRTTVDIVLTPDESSWFKKFTRRIGYLFKSKEKRLAKC